MKEQLIQPVGDFTISEIQKERGSVYGEFKYQAECVGRIMGALIDCSNNNHRGTNYTQIGSCAYIAIKLARYAVTPNHKDTLL